MAFWVLCQALHWRKWVRVWRSPVNTETKLLMMTRAFEELGAVRVQWQTDQLNLRSQAAIERLGATKEGVLRRHMHAFVTCVQAQHRVSLR